MTTFDPKEHYDPQGQCTPGDEVHIVQWRIMIPTLGVRDIVVLNEPLYCSKCGAARSMGDLAPCCSCGAG